MNTLQKQQAKYYILCSKHVGASYAEIIKWADSLIREDIVNESIIEISMSKKRHDVKTHLCKSSEDVSWDGIIEAFLFNQIANNKDHQSLNTIFRGFWHNEFISEELISELYGFDHLIDDCHHIDTTADETKVLKKISRYCKDNCILELITSDK